MKLTHQLCDDVWSLKISPKKKELKSVSKQPTLKPNYLLCWRHVKSGWLTISGTCSMKYDSISKLLVNKPCSNKTYLLHWWCVSCWFTVSSKKVKHTILQNSDYYQKAEINLQTVWWCLKIQNFTEREWNTRNKAF